MDSLHIASSRSDDDACALEPIHMPGTIQPHGILIVLDETLRILQISANVESLLGRSAESLVGTRFLEQVEADAAAGVERLIREAASTFVNPFRVPLRSSHGASRMFDGIAHMLEGVGMILELEADPADRLSGDVMPGLDNYLQVVQRSLARISEVSEIIEIAGVMVRDVKAFTGFDRVMIYRFAPDFHGEVIAEAIEEGMEQYLGLHYPASDIPSQARELYRKNPVRLLQDVNAIPSPLVPALDPATGLPTDLSRAVLRAFSPVHTQYLKNMGVGASLSISLVVEDRLWGLIACHHRTPRFVSYAIRATASFYATVMAAQLDLRQRQLDDHRIAEARSTALSILTSLRAHVEPIGILPPMLPRFMELFEASGAALITSKRIYRYGLAPDDPTLLALRAELDQGEALRISSRTSLEFSSLIGCGNAAGLVAIDLGGMEWLVLFRREVSRQIKWAGEPALAKTRDGAGALTPRKSFALWLESVEGESEPWPEQTASLTTEMRIGLLEILRHRNALLERSNEDLRRFAGVVAHEVKNQLQAGVMALSILQEKLFELDPKAGELASLGRDQLSGLSKFTNDMLAFAQADTSMEAEELDLNFIARQVVVELEAAGMADGASIRIMELPPILGPGTQIRHLIANLVRNALLHGRRGGNQLTVEIGSRNDHEGTVVFVRDDGCGVPPSQRQKIFEYFYRGGTGAVPGSGIGLAFCAQIMDRLGQRMWVEDAPFATGVSFCFTVTTVPKAGGGTPADS